MIHKTAAKRADGTGWHYCAMTRNGGAPLGYCAEHEPHPTEAEARECYSRYRRDHMIRLNAGHSRNQQFRCEVCGEWTQDYAEVGQVWIIELCADHMTVEGVLTAHPDLNEPAGDSWES